MDLIVFGLNHRSAPIPVREAWSLSLEQSRRALQDLRNRHDGSEHVILSTCNRTEFYSYVPATKPLPEDGAQPGAAEFTGNCASPNELGAHLPQTVLEFYGSICEAAAGNKLPSTSLEHCYFRRQDDAIAHLFRLAGGLDSMIVGESQILGQLKAAFSVAQEQQTVGSLFHELFPAALRVGKRVHSGTGISEGCITPGQAALRLAEQTLHSLAGKRALLVGCGKIGTLTAKAFRDHQIDRFVVVNRTRANADELIADLGVGVTAPWEELDNELAEADVVITSTGSLEPILSAARLNAIQARRGGRPLVLVDIAVPRDVDPAAVEIDNVHLFNFDDLNSVIQENIERRIERLPKAEEIVQRELQQFQAKRFYLQVDPVLRHVVERFEQIRLGELQKFISQLPPEYHPILKEMSSSLVKKLLHFPIQKLKSLRNVQGLSASEVAFLKRLFLTGP